MESFKSEYMSRIRKVLSVAYREKEKIETGGLSRVRVMGHILSMESQSPEAGYLEMFQQMLWRLAPVTCVLLVVLAVTLAKMDFIDSYELAKSFINDPADFILLTLYYG
jgi:hypothetical protein